MNEPSGPTKDGYQAHPLSQLDRFLETWEKLGEGERNVLMTFLMRLYAGQRLHGKLTRDKKDWTFEALEEALDGAVYLSCALEAACYKAFSKSLADAEKEVVEARTVHEVRGEPPETEREGWQDAADASYAAAFRSGAV